MVDVSRLIKRGIPQVNPNRPTNRVDPNAAGVGLLGDVINLGGAAADLGIKLQVRADTVDAQDRLNKINAEKRALLNGTPSQPNFGDDSEEEAPGGEFRTQGKPGFLSLQKKAAAAGAAGAADALEEILKKHSAGASSGTTALLAASIASIRNSTNNTISIHAAAQLKAFELDVHNTQKAEALQNAVGEANNNPEAAIGAANSAGDAERTYQLNNGADQKTADSLADTVATDMYLAILKELVTNQDNPEAAQVMYDELVKDKDTSKRFDKDRRGEILKTIQAARPVRAVIDATTEIIDTPKKSWGELHTAEGATAALAAARSKKFPGFSAKLQSEMQEKLAKSVSSRLDQIRTLDTRRKADRDKALSESANSKLGKDGAVLTTEETDYLERTGGLQNYQASQEKALVGDNGVTDENKEIDFHALDLRTELPFITREELESDWLPHFAEKKGTRDIMTKKDVIKKWESARDKHISATATRATLARTKQTEKETALDIGTYANETTNFINSMGLTLTDNRKQIGRINRGVQHDITIAVATNGGRRLTPAEVTEMYRRQAILINTSGTFSSNQVASKFGEFDSEFTRAGVPSEFVDELAAAAVGAHPGKKTTTTGDAVPLAEPDDMISIWNTLKEEGLMLPIKGETFGRIRDSLARAGIKIGDQTSAQISLYYAKGVLAGHIKRGS